MLTKSIGHARPGAAFLWIVLLVALAGCSSGTSTPRELTQRERDSTLGRTGIPGSATVTKALEVSDRSKNAAAELDAQVEAASH